MLAKRAQRVFAFFLISLFLFSCGAGEAVRKSPFAKDNLLAWCIVPYDSVKRNAQARAQMLQDLGFSQYAYDWRAQHLPLFAEEIMTMKDYGIKLEAVWFWIDGTPGKLLDENNLHILRTLREHKVRAQLWVSFNQRFFENLSDSQRLSKAIEALREIRRNAREIGGQIGLYNHGDWFGNPLNQIKIIEALGGGDIGIIYNFHHAHDQVEDFAALLAKMKPYLWTVNLNGMKASGPKILPLGQGDHELEMLRALKNSGFAGTIGILGHVEDEDARVVLERNLAGLQSLLKQLDDRAALRTY